MTSPLIDNQSSQNAADAVECAYAYKALPIDEHHIRLLEILPGCDTDPIRVRISCLSLSQVFGAYNALSYMWGPPRPTHKVWVNDQYVIVRENLWRFLRHYRKVCRDNRAPLLWTDSICINQEDLIEKGSQIQAMDKVYSGARRVLIWLGDISEKEHLTNKDIDLVLELRKTHFSHAYLAANDFFSEQEEFSLAEKESAGRLLACASNIANHQYWLRLWIVQEVSLAKGNAVIIQGSHILDYDVLGVMRHVEASGTECNSNAWESFSRLTRDSRSEVEKPVVSNACLTSLLTQYNAQLCENLRDRIYGLLGLIAPTLPASRISVDYTINIWIMFLRVLDLLLEERNKPGLDSDRSTISQLRLAARTFDFHTLNLLNSIEETTQKYPQLSITFQVLSLEFRDWSESGLLRLPLSDLLSQCELCLPFSTSDCHLLPAPQNTPGVSQQYRLIVKQFRKPCCLRVSRLRPSDHLRPFESVRGRIWIYVLDEGLSLGLKFFARGRIQLLGHVDAAEGSDGLYKITKLPADLYKYLQDKVNRCMSTEDWSILKGKKMQISSSLLRLLQLLS